jgi:hypothetical protein
MNISHRQVEASYQYHSNQKKIALNHNSPIGQEKNKLLIADNYN